MNTTRTTLALLVIVLAGGGLIGCSWTETICSDGEYTVEYAEGGGGCEKLTRSDPDCPDGRILRKSMPSGREDCIVDDVTKDPDPVPAKR